MSINLRKGLLFTFSFLVLIGLYWQCLHGTPIWDDEIFWFHDSVMTTNDFSYAFVWQHYGWPLSVSLQKALYSLFQRNYLGYHLFNIVLHFINSLLVYRLGRILNLKYRSWYFLLFLFHPAVVVTTGWMIQVKTLFSFFFALTSFFAYLKGNKRPSWMILSWILFACSILCKSASLFLPFIFLFMSYRSFRYKKLLWLIPFFVLSLFGAVRVLKSPVTKEGVSKAIRSSEVKPPAEKTIQIEEKKVGPTVPVSDVKKVELPDERKNANRSKNLYLPGLSNIPFIFQTLYYYFWQSFLPIHNEPVKGPQIENAGVIEFVHLLFLVMVVFLLLKDRAIYALAAAHILMIPFLGIVPAPYMTITWVSDQHLYLVLPAMLAFWMMVLEKLKWKFSWPIPALFLAVYLVKTFESTKYYQNQFVFYEKSLALNPYNVAIAYNLTAARIASGQWEEALRTAESILGLAEEEPWMKENLYYKNLEALYEKLKSGLEKYGH